MQAAHCLLITSQRAGVAGLAALLLACSAPAPVAVPASRAQPLMSFQEADSLAHSYGFVTSFTLGMRQRAPGWQASWPVGPRWQSLAPGHLPGLRGRIAADSLLAYAHEPRCEYNYRVSYPAFTGPRATARLQQLVRYGFDVLADLTERRRHPLFAPPCAKPTATTTKFTSTTRKPPGIPVRAWAPAFWAPIPW